MAVRKARGTAWASKLLNAYWGGNRLLKRAWRYRLSRATGKAAVGVTAALCLVATGTWWSGGPGTTPSPLYLRRPSIDGMNVSRFIDGPRHLTLTPRTPLEACSSGGGEGVEVLLVVPSSPQNTEARSAVRESWGAYLPSNWAIVFYMGAVDRKSVQERLKVESQAHGDIAQDSTFTDNYSNLTLKTLAFLSWAYQACPSATFLFRVDDDVYLNVPKLRGLVTCLNHAMRGVVENGRTVASGQIEEGCEGVTSLVSHHTDAGAHRSEPYVFAGRVILNEKPHRYPACKWYVPKSSYPKSTFPPYLTGGAYLVSVNVLGQLLDGARKTPAIFLEDVYLTGLVASEQVKLRLSKLEGVEYFPQWYQGVCTYEGVLSVHGFPPDELRAVTLMASGASEAECDGVFTRLGLALSRVITAIYPRNNVPLTCLF